MDTRPTRLYPLLLAVALGLSACGRPGTFATAVPRGPALLRAADLPLVASETPPAPDEATQLPRFTRTSRGQSGDPVNVVIAGSERQLAEGFVQAGWLPADPVTFWNALRMLRAGATRGEYPTAPMSPLHLYDRKQDQSWQKNPRSIISRDHLRVWKAPVVDPLGRPYWVVAATQDIAIYWNKTRPTHRIDPNIDAERELVVKDWLGTGLVARKSAYLSTAPGYRGVNGEGDPFVTDGMVVVLELVEEPSPASNP